jgi:hypothetical protein
MEVQALQKARPYFQNNQNKQDWRYGSTGRALNRKKRQNDDPLQIYIAHVYKILNNNKNYNYKN